MTSSLALLGLPELFLVLVMFPLALAFFVFWVWMLIHAIQNRGLTDAERIVWVIVIVFVNLLGAVIYCFIGRPQANGAMGPPPRTV